MKNHTRSKEFTNLCRAIEAIICLLGMIYFLIFPIKTFPSLALAGTTTYLLLFFYGMRQKEMNFTMRFLCLCPLTGFVMVLAEIIGNLIEPRWLEFNRKSKS
jgi:hypothetical protein